MSPQLEPCGTAGLSALASARALSVWDSGCTCSVFSSGCFLCAWGGAGLAHKEWMGDPGVQQWEGTVGAECSRHHAGKQKGIAIFFKVLHILEVQVTRVAWALLCSASALQWVPGSCWGCRAPPYPADMCQSLSACGQEPSPGFALSVSLLILEC